MTTFSIFRAERMFGRAFYKEKGTGDPVPICLFRLRDQSSTHPIYTRNSSSLRGEPLGVRQKFSSKV